MRLLLDTHILLWVLEDNPQLSLKARELIRNTTNEVFVSTASLMEIAIKIKVGKLVTRRTSTEIADEMTRVLSIQLQPILPRHLDAYDLVPLYENHRDPFDRLLIATALSENLTLVSDDTKFSYYVSIIDLLN